MTCRTLETTDIKTTGDQFDALWATVHKTRFTSRTVTVDKKALICLLMDHSSLYDAVFSKPFSSTRR